MEPNQTPDPSPHNRLSSGIVAAGAAFALTLAGLGVAAAQTDDTPSSSTTEAPAAESTTETPAAGGDMRGPRGHGGRHHRPGGPGGHAGETALTGEQAERATAAAQAAVPGGTIKRVETDADGAAFEAHVEKADGTHVTVKMDENFNVTGVEEHTKPS